MHVLGVDVDQVERSAILNVDHLNTPHGWQLPRERRRFRRIDMCDDLHDHYARPYDVICNCLSTRF
jgi:hypothetical protein